MTTEKIGQRGKKAEKIVDALLRDWNSRADFSFHRMADARAARGRVSASPGDFLYVCGGIAGFIEVKSTEHDYRLSRDKVTQLPTLRKFELAGMRSMVLIHHSKLNAWRVLTPIDMDATIPSWDMRNIPTYPSAEDALLSTGYFHE